MDKLIHDLNNQISVIQLSAQLLKKQLTNESQLTPKLERYLSNIIQSANSSVELTRQISEHKPKRLAAKGIKHVSQDKNS